MVVKDEEFYIDMAIKSVMDHADIFIVDTGSKDNTIGIIKDFQKEYVGRIVLEEKDFGGYEDRWSPNYLDAEVHNYAMGRAREIFDPYWLILLDGDEIYLGRFWEVLKEAEESDEFSLGYSEVVPVTPHLICDQEIFYATWGRNKNGKLEYWRMFDPHVKTWASHSSIVWGRRSPDENLHIIPRIETGSTIGFVSDDHFHVHLHHSFGPKSLYNYMLGHRSGRLWEAQHACPELGIDRKDAYKQKVYEEIFPQYFDSKGRFIPPKQEESWVKDVISIKNPLPDYVIERWRRWGDWPC